MYKQITIKWYGFLLALLLLGACSTQTKLEWNEEQHYRWAEVDPGFFGHSGFEALPSSQTNIHFVNEISEDEIAENRHYLNGSGVATGDVDGDGLADIYLAGLGSTNKLYRNLGNMEFEDITEASGVAHEGYYSTGAVFADVDNDGDLDLLITAMHKSNALYINDGTGAFSLKENSGLGAARGSTTMDLADVDKDGDLDLYLTNYKDQSVKDKYSANELALQNILNEPYNRQNQTGPFTLKKPFDEHYALFMSDDNRLMGVAEKGEYDEMYINEGGVFKKVTDTKQMFLDAAGKPLGLQADWGLTAKFQDLNGDHYPDLYVSNDFFSEDRLWFNQQDGTFKLADWKTIRNMSFSSMAVDFSDINLDGQQDIFVTEMLSSNRIKQQQQMGADGPSLLFTDSVEAQPQYNRNSLYLQRLDRTYAEITHYSRAEATGWSWATRFMDVDLDGYEDLIINTGYTYDILDIDTQVGMINDQLNMDEDFDVLIERAPDLKLTNIFLKNTGNLSFEDKSEEWGFTQEDVSHGLATADFDNDGDLDFISNRLKGSAIVFENRSNAPRVLIRLRQEGKNHRGVGAKIKLTASGEKPKIELERQLSAGGDYLSGSTPAALFGVKEEVDYRLEIFWPDGTYNHLENIKANRIYEIYKNKEEGKSPSEILADTNENTYTDPPMFEDISGKIDHVHHEAPFFDSDYQALLPINLNKMGPGVTWFDIDNDSYDDLLIGSGRGGKMGAFRNKGNGVFEKMQNQQLFQKRVPGDQTAIIGWSVGDEKMLLIGSANYEQGDPRVPAAYLYRLSANTIEIEQEFSSFSTAGVLTAADYDNDGDIDLFIGGRFMPGRYPAAATSTLYINDQGTYIKDETNSRKLRELGLVTAAVFSDYDRDGDQDLIISREWDSILILENQRGNFNDISTELGLAEYKGWWNGVSTGDINGDGRPDIIASNIGLNSSYQMEYSRPLRLYYGDFNGDQVVDIFEAIPDEQGNYHPRKKLEAYRSFPFITNKFRSYRAFAEATMQEIFSRYSDKVPYKKINTLEHMVFMQTGDGFTAKPLPKEAQFSAGYHTGVADVNNDGHEDLLMSQNYFGTQSEVPRLDAGRGLLLTGDGTGNLMPLPGSRSGITVFGQQRGAAFSDFDHNGAVDMAISQNSNRTKLYRNTIAKKGYRITLIGSPANRDAIGSAIRLVYSDSTKGPLREIQSTSGYWSQSSYTQVLGYPSTKQVEAVEVQWYDGRVEIVDIPVGNKTLTIRYK